jgi:purine-binding chemotaxis protein CheW
VNNIMEHTKQYCSFFVGDLFFGVDVREVQEVIRYQAMTKVPLAPPEIGGLINLRGQIVTAVDLRHRLKMSERQPDRHPMNVVIRNRDCPVSLLVDEIGDVLQPERNAFERPPETLKGVARELIQGVYKLKDQLLLILDTEKAVNLLCSAA